MRFSTLIVVLILIAAGIFAYQNQTLLYQDQMILVPGGTAAVPLIGILLLAGVTGVVLLWLTDMIAAGAAAARARRADRRLRELSDQVAALNKRIDERLSQPAGPPAPPRDAAAAQEVDKEQTSVWRRTG